MNYWILTLSMLNILLMTFVMFSWLSKNKNKVEDQRLTKGLQLLQNKISILQDLSDRSDEQVRKWVHLIEQKSGDVQNQLILADEKIIQIETTLSKALDVSKIFYEQVPHAEIAERQRTSKYVQAAKLAHQGFTADQISQKTDLSIAEIDMIIKMNKDHLQFSEENLPAWIDTVPENENREQEVAEFSSQLKKMNQMVSATAFDINNPDLTSMNSIQQQFNDTVISNTQLNTELNPTQIPQTFVDEKTATAKTVETKTDDGKIVRPFEFRRIVVNKN